MKPVAIFQSYFLEPEIFLLASLAEGLVSSLCPKASEITQWGGGLLFCDRTYTELIVVDGQALRCFYHIVAFRFLLNAPR